MANCTIQLTQFRFLLTVRLLRCSLVFWFCRFFCFVFFFFLKCYRATIAGEQLAALRRAANISTPDIKLWKVLQTCSHWPSYSVTCIWKALCICGILQSNCRDSSLLFLFFWYSSHVNSLCWPVLALNYCFVLRMVPNNLKSKTIASILNFPHKIETP